MLYLIALHGVVVYFAVDKYVLGPMIQNAWTPGAVPAPSVPPMVTPAAFPSLTPPPGVETPTPPPVAGEPAKLLIPVVGIRPEQLIDTFSQARGEERVHEAIDIAAPQMTPVVAAADGEIVKFFDSELGGVTIYQISTDKRYFFYYAHLHSRAPGLEEGQPVAQGTVIGYVGDTGNAGAGNFHLHFSINAVKDTKRFWDGVSINPYPVLRGEQSLP
ncbi:MAG: peptidoglycan DD-metalloendopeptidase family protein [bacterium]|nr:peptidoglycan DD-metalloendopeptidase family protein [bacterium]